MYTHNDVIKRDHSKIPTDNKTSRTIKPNAEI